MSTPTIDAAREWLATADTDADHAYRWWAAHRDGIAILPLGRAFDAVEVPAALEHQILDDPAIDGPIIKDDGIGILFVLVPPHTDMTWDASVALCRGDLHYLPIPDPERRGPLGVHWLRPPDGSGRLTNPARLAAVLAELVSR
jgi:hypothetical protein